MRANEFLTEAISLTQYREDLIKAIDRGVGWAMEVIARYRDEDLEQRALESPKPYDVLFAHYFSETEFYPSLEQSIGLALNKTFNKIFKERYANYVYRPSKKERKEDPEAAVAAFNATLQEKLSTYLTADWGEKVKFVTGMPEGQKGAVARDTYLIKLNREHFLNKIVTSIKNMVHITQTARAQYKSKVNPVDVLFSNVDRVIRDGFYSIGRNTAEELSLTIEHEMVHVFQNFEQYYLRGRPSDYRSYLEKDPEKFDTIMRDKTDPRHWAIYHASPQEITAFSHELASKIIRDYNLNVYNKNIEKIDANTILFYVKSHLEASIPYPKTSDEVKVYQRYARLVYSTLANHIVRIKKAHAQEDEKWMRDIVDTDEFWAREKKKQKLKQQTLS